METICGKCGGLKFLTKKGNRVQCPCVAQHRAEIYLRKMRPFTPATEFIKKLQKVTHEGNLLIQIPEALTDVQKVKWIFGFLLLRGGIRRSYDLFSAFELLSLFLGREAGDPSPWKIISDVLCLYYGFHEPRNSMQGEVLLQVLELRASKGLKNWVMIRGTPVFKRMVEDYALSRDYEVVNLGGPQAARVDSPGPKVDNQAPKLDSSEPDDGPTTAASGVKQRLI